MGKKLPFKRQGFFVLVCCSALSLTRLPNGYAEPPQASAQRPPTKAPGQQTARPHPPVIPPGMRLLNLKEGRALAQNMAWADDEEGLSPDCSHLVHALYEQAGYPYSYASSIELYRGAGHFLRVRYPHPGDLIVWPGHVGVIVDPAEHTFFSTTSSGARTQDYTSPYWRARGHARYFRYLTSAPAKSTESVLSVSNLPPERMDAPPKVQAVKTSPAPTEASEKPRGDAATANTVRADDTSPIPLRSSGKQPQVGEVTAALSEANLAAGEILRAGDLEHLEQPVMIYQDLQVGSIEVKGKRGTAQVQFETVAILSAERMESTRSGEERKLDLQRTQKGWVLTAPSPKNVYVPRDAALRVLAARLAELTKNGPAGERKEREQADIIRILNLLIE